MRRYINTRLSADTQGLYLRAEKHEELVDRFRRIRTYVARPAYRLRFPQPIEDEVTVVIGSGDTRILLPIRPASIATPPESPSTSLGA